MSSTYSTSLRIQLIDTGTDDEAWGQPTNNNIGTIIEQAITGVNSISLTNLTSLTLSAANAAVDQSRNAVLVFTGAPTANCNVVAPSVSKVYVVSNETTGGFIVNLKTSAGDPLPIAAGSRQLVFCNGTAFTSVVNPNAIQGNLNVSGSANIGGNITVGNNVVLRKDITSTSNNFALNSASNVVSFKNNTGALKIPSGTTGQRPGTPVLGMQRWNSDRGVVEVWNGSVWLPITGATQGVYLIVAGGGGGGTQVFSSGGGGGAGGLLTGTFFANVSTSYSIVVGSGGGVGVSGTNSSGFGVTAIGGGYGGGSNSPGGSFGGSGGSGGGTGIGGSVSGGSGTAGQGFAGGIGRGDPFAGGAGGGAGAAGGNAGSGTGGVGGIGIQSSINGTATYYAGGGGGGGSNQSGGQDGQLPGAGGLGGGGYGGYGGPDGSGSVATSGVPGTNGLGGGGGGGARVGQYGSTSGGAGGSGVVIAAYASPSQRATGGTVTTYTSGGITYWVHTFTTSGTLAF
jgi:hypothetical protein